MSSEQLHRALREKLLSTVRTGGGTLMRTYRNLHRSDTGRGIKLADFKEAVYRYDMGVTDAQVGAEKGGGRPRPGNPLLPARHRGLARGQSLARYHHGYRPSLVCLFCLLRRHDGCMLAVGVVEGRGRRLGGGGNSRERRGR